LCGRRARSGGFFSFGTSGKRGQKAESSTQEAEGSRQKTECGRRQPITRPEHKSEEGIREEKRREEKRREEKN
jgi:hypothetical protein